MPRLLGAIFWVFLVSGPLVILLAVLPGTKRIYLGRPLSYEEFWIAGGGLLVSACGLAMAGIARGIYKRRRWVRLALPLLCFSAALGELLVPFERSIYEWVLAAVAVLFVFWYFNCKHSVARYFRPGV